MVLKDLLDKENFQYLKVLNDNPDLSRTIITVESTETPDVAQYIPQGTLLLMTGMAFKDDPAHMCAFLEDLDKSSCAGVAIKLGRFIDRLDEHVLDVANQLGIPILQIPMDKTLGEVYQEILSYIWNDQNYYLLGALNTQQKIANLILQGNSMKSILNNMALILKKPIMVMDLFGNILEYGYTCTKVVSERVAETVGMAMKEDGLDEGAYSMIEREGSRICVYPVKGVGRNTNYVILLDFDPREKEGNLLIMEQIIMALELYFYKNLYVKYNEMKLREEFLTFFLEQLDNKTWNERQILMMGSFYGLKQMSEYRVVILEMGKEDQRKFDRINFARREERYILTYDCLHHLQGDKNKILIFPQESKWRYVCLIQGKQADYLHVLTHIHDLVKEKFNFDMTIARGVAVSSVKNIKNSFHEAERCFADGSRDEELPYLLSYKPQNMMELFKLVPEREIRDICEFTLKELAYPQDKADAELRKTLSTYLFCDKCITKTAEDLFVHRNTIKYRLKRCGEILGTDFSDVSRCFQIQLALILTEYAQ